MLRGPAGLRVRLLRSLVVVVTVGAGLLTTTGAHAAGETQWVRRYNGPLNRDDAGTAVAVSPDGTTVFVTGWSIGVSASLDYATAAYDAATGTREWIRRYDDPAHGTDEAFALAVSPNGTTVFVTGLASQPGGESYGTVAYAADTGATRWFRRYMGPAGFSQASAIGVSPDGTTVFVTGFSEGTDREHSDYATVAYDAATGTKEWVRRYDVQGEAFALTVSPDGTTVFVTGGSTGSTGSLDYATIAYAADTGATRWVRRYNSRGDGGDVARAVAVSPDGSTVFVTGGSTFNYLTLAYEAGTGSTVWHRRYRGTCPCNDQAGQQANAVAVSPDGATVFVSGGSIGSTSTLDYATVAYDAGTGARRWTRRHNGPANGDDVAYSLAVSPDGATVYATGAIAVSIGGLTAYFTVAYDAATGATGWHRRYEGPGKLDDLAFSLAVSPDGASVFVTGRAFGTDETSDDFATVAYAA
jgi:WD40 repeat protein